MKKQEKQTVTGFILTALLIVIIIFPSNKACGQSKIAKENHQNWARMVAKLHLKLPKNLPPSAKDPNWPGGTFQKEGSHNWYDTAGNFLKYAREWNASDLKVDSHELFAMCAPRPVFVSCGNSKVEGRWMDDRGQFMAEVAANPVYKLLGKQGLQTNKMPPIGTALLNGNLAFRQHFGPHTVIPNWPFFIRFVLHYFKPVPVNE